MITEYPRSTWATPDYVFDVFNREAQFTLDAAASASNTKVPDRFWTREDNAFVQVPRPGERIWLNPPYSGPRAACRGLHFGEETLAQWLDLAYRWVTVHEAQLVYVLVLCDTGTAWFQENARRATRTRLLSPRIEFVPPNDDTKDGGNRGPSCLFEFHRRLLNIGVIQPCSIS